MKVVRFLIIAVIIAACSNNTKTESNEKGSVATPEMKSDIQKNEFTAESFSDVWWNNPSEAIEKHSNKEVIVTGLLARDGQTDNVYLQGSSDSKLFIACTAAFGNDFSSYKKDELIKVKGICVGMTMSINIKECVIIK